jgi:hypothetical protein
MPSWKEVEAEAPEVALLARERIEAHGLGLLATLRRDGSPRLSGIEPLFALDELWLGMMDSSLKARDLQRDPRFELHNATVDKEVKDGDVRISARAIEVHDTETIDAMRKAFAGETGYEPPPGPMHLFKADVTRVVTLKPAGDHLDIASWTEDEGVKVVERY